MTSRNFRLHTLLNKIIRNPQKLKTKRASRSRLTTTKVTPLLGVRLPSMWLIPRSPKWAHLHQVRRSRLSYVDPLDSMPPLAFGRLPSVSLGSEEDEELSLVNIRLCLFDFFLLILTLFCFAFLVASMALLLLHMPRNLLPAMLHKRSSR